MTSIPPETAPPADDTTLESPPPPADNDTTVKAPPPPADDTTVESPPPPADDTTVESPPPPADDTTVESPPSLPPPSTPASSTPSPPADTSPPPEDDPPSVPPPSKTTPSQFPPPDKPTSPPAPTGGSPPARVFSPPTPNAIASQTPPSAVLSPPAPRTNPSVPSPSSSDSNADIAILVGIVSGGLLILALTIVCLLCCSRRRMKKRQNYMEHGPPPKGGDQYNNGSSKQNSPAKDLIVNLPPAPGFNGTPVGGWGTPSPQHVAYNSNEFNTGQSMQPSPTNMGGYGAKSQFTYEELAAATGGFSQDNLLGQGGFGFVHKGVLPNGKEVAVKSLKTGSGQGEREFQAEVEIISRVHHRHLVSLVGYCIAGDKRMLVYEFVPNKTLEFHLHGRGQPVMDWASRLRIARGSAKGLAYLHEDCVPRIIHRDIKAANILLDFNFEAMVADFGLAKLTSDNYTHVSTRVMGTFGYLAPEYAASGKLTEKSDVFSFGVMLLELITGRQPVDPTSKIMEDSLVDWARPLLSKALEDGNYSQLVDPGLEDNYVPQEMARMIACAAASIRHSARRRPRMSQIVRALDGDSTLDDLNEVVKPGQSAAYNPSENAEIYDTFAYNADIMKFRQMVMASQEFNNSVYGATSSSSGDSKEMGLSSPETQKQ